MKEPIEESLPEIVENRPVAYTALFEGELPYNPQPSEQDIGLSGYWRAYTEKKGRHGNILQDILDGTPVIVQRVLREHEQAAHSGNTQAEAVFGLIDPDQALPILNNITTQAMQLWEKALYRGDYPSLLRSAGTTIVTTATELSQAQQERLVHLLTSKNLIVETAAAAMQCLPDFATKPVTPSKAEQADLASLLANWGPRFVTEWMDGTIINKWLDNQSLTITEKQDWRTIFTPSLRKHFAVHNINDPLAALERVKVNLDLLTYQAIAERLGWQPSEVRDIFTPSMRKYFAVGNINDPLAALKRVKVNLDLLTDQAIAERLGWQPSEVRDVFTPSMRKYFAVHNINDPLAALERVKVNLDLLTDQAIAERLGWQPSEVRDIFTPSLRKYFAVRNINDPLAALERVKVNLDLLTDQAIAERLGWQPNEVRDIFTPSMRKHFAVGNINDPLAGIKDYVDGKITINGRYFSDQK